MTHIQWAHCGFQVSTFVYFLPEVNAYCTVRSYISREIQPEKQTNAFCLAFKAMFCIGIKS